MLKYYKIMIKIYFLLIIGKKIVYFYSKKWCFVSDMLLVIFNFLFRMDIIVVVVIDWILRVIMKIFMVCRKLVIFVCYIWGLLRMCFCFFICYWLCVFLVGICFLIVIF